MIDDDTMLTLAEAAEQLFPAASGVTADTLKRRARQGMLRVYRPGKSFLTTRRDVRAMLDASAVKREPEPRPVSPFKREPPLPLGLTQDDLSEMALDQILKEQRQRREAQNEAAKAARKREAERIKRERAAEKRKP